MERFTGIDKNCQNITVNLVFGCKTQNIITRDPMDSFLRKPDIRVFSNDYSTIFFLINETFIVESDLDPA